jgi:hypothetical protein
MDEEIVATSIDVAYRETIEYLKTRNASLGRNYGNYFLSKIVQLSIAVPEPDAMMMRSYLAYVTGNEAPKPEAAQPDPAEEQVQEFEHRIEERQPENPVDVGVATSDLGAEERMNEAKKRALEEAARRARARRFSVDSPDVAAAEFDVLQCLTPNPRQIKRFDNAFRLQLHVANSAGVPGLTFNRHQLVALGKWVALRLRWPDFAKAIDDDEGLLPALESSINSSNDESSKSSEGLAALQAKYQLWFSDGQIEVFLTEPEPQRLISSLPLLSLARIV